MKITDYALIFIGVTLPFILIAYINIALMIRTYQQEMYYQRVIDSAVEDTLSEMKRIESDEITNDYGYSGAIDNKISINAEVAISTFFESIYGSLNIHADKTTQSIIQLYVPVVAIIDYNGVYISSVEQIGSETKHVLKPKRYFAFQYGVDSFKDIYVLQDNKWYKLNYNGTSKKYELNASAETNINFAYQHNLEFTTDDRVFDTYSEPGYVLNVTNKVMKYKDSKEFYINDLNNNKTLFLGMNTIDKTAFINFLNEMKKKVMVEIVTEELTYAANKNNEYAHKKGISYNFAFTVESSDEMYNYIENVGVLALVQGIKVGNKYLNYKAYNMSDLVLTHKYYLTEGSTNFSKNLYHKTNECLEYDVCVKTSLNDQLKQRIVYTREAAAQLGYYPCPLCNP